MKIVIAPDKFKGSLTGFEFCDIVEAEIKAALPEAEIMKLPLADGGDGTMEILKYHLNGKRIKVEVNDPLFRPIKADYLYIESSETAYIEMAEASGLKLLSENEQNCFLTTTYGTGLMILHAIENGAKNIVLGIGGSATNDCGVGMAFALGYQFLDDEGDEVIPVGKNLTKIKSIDTSNVNIDLKNVTFEVACDVTNPLYGKNGAAYVYAPQKGASPMEIIALDQGLKNMSDLFIEKFDIDVQVIKGTGAAGGMGAGALVFLNAKLISGIELIKELIDFDNKIKDATWIITGEGTLDHQTLSGKLIFGVLESANKYNIPMAIFAGSVKLSKEEINKLGIKYVDSILYRALDLKDAMDSSHQYLKIISSEFVKSMI